MTFLIYNFLVAVTSPLWLPYAWYRSSRRKEKVRWAERLGRMPLNPGPDRVWVHAVSVGEVHAVVPILKGLRARVPGWEIVLSTTTSSGQQAARDGAKGLFDHLVYYPLDVASFCLNAMIHVRPRAVLIMETELWMNFLWAAKVVGAKTFVVNGRVSDRSFPRAMRLRFFYRRLLSYVDRCLMQSDTDRERIVALGAAPERAVNTGNTKFDQAAGAEVAPKSEAAIPETQDPRPETPPDARAEFGVPLSAPCVVVGSTRSAGEEELVLDALAEVRKAIPELFAILAPRHVERADEVAAAMGAHGFQPARRSESGGGERGEGDRGAEGGGGRDGGPEQDPAGSAGAESAESPSPSAPPPAHMTPSTPPSPPPDSLLLDTFGELGRAYAAGDVAVVGGGFGGFGGQNIFQPLALGKPTLFGPAMQNFRDIADLSLREGVGFQVSTAVELAAELHRLLRDDAARTEIAAKAERLIRSNQGASKRIVDEVLSAAEES